MSPVEQLESPTGDSRPQRYDALRPYQLEGVQFLHQRASALLADEMGLGKTVQTIVALWLGRTTYRRILIIAPTSLCLNWQREVEKWAPDLTVRRVTGTAEDRRFTYRLPIQVLISSYEQIRLDCRDVAAHVRFDLIIIDEAQRIKNNASGVNLACRIIPRERSWALSGTPLENDPQDLLAIFGFLKPQLLRASMSKVQIHDAIQPHFLRRTKDEVLKDLPPIIYRDLRLELPPKQRRAYDSVWSERNALKGASRKDAAIGMLAMLTRLKQICNFDDESGESVKMEVLSDLLERAEIEGEKVLIFSQYVKTLEWISERLDTPYDIYHGQLSQTARDNVLVTFRNHAGPRVLLMSLQAGGVGLNLQNASTVVLFDRWWNPAKEDQAIHRAHRYGRESVLQVFRFVVEDSVEQRIDAILHRKRDLFNDYISDAPQLKSESLQALREILDL